MGVMTRVQLPFLRAHQWLYERTDGRVGHRLLGVPTLLLHTTGRRSGVPRTSALVYLDDTDTWCVVASNGGDDRPPGWFFNIGAQPLVEVQVARRRVRARATVIERGAPEHARLWAALNELNHHRFEGYQQRTDRPIPIVRLTPVD